MSAPATTEAARNIIAATDSALSELEAVLEASDRVTLHGDDAHDWTAADVWAHLGRWLAASADVIERQLQGERDIHDYDDADALNLRWIEEDHALDVDVARSRALEAWGQVRTLIADVDEVRWNGFVQAYAQGNGGGHILEHIRYVVDAAGAAPPPVAVERLQRDRLAWGALVAALDARPGVALHDPESPGWTSKEIFGHFAHWIEWGTTAFEAQRAGQQSPDMTETFEEANTRWAAEDGSVDLETLRARALRLFGRRAQLIASTPAEQWTEAMLATVAEDGYDHIAEHHRFIGGSPSV